MRSISHKEHPATVTPEPHVSARNLALDRARTFLTIIVVIHHSVIPYTYFGHTDPRFWIGFDAVVLATDSFFMAMFFFLSGLFVWPSLAHRADGTFLRDRFIRLGLPFTIAALTVIPIAYYAIALRQTPGIGFGEFWWKTVTVGPWPSGPVWFVWVLLVFDAVAGLLYRTVPRCLEPINRLSLRGFDSPVTFYLFLASVTAVLYIPCFLYYGPSYWFEFGPFSVQASRVLLYAAYFFIGAGIGMANYDRGVLSCQGRLPQQVWIWAAVTIVPYTLLWVLIFIKREILGNPDQLPHWYNASYGLFFVLFSAAILFALLAYFLRYKRGGFSVLDPMQHDAYGIFLVHYPFVLWTQYWLYDMNLPAIVKAVIAFAVTLALSWATTALLRKIPGANHVL